MVKILAFMKHNHFYIGAFFDETSILKNIAQLCFDYCLGNQSLTYYLCIYIFETYSFIIQTF